MDKDNTYGMRSMHVELLKLLFDYNSLCNQNGIKYSLAFGSMLGAVREHGIIPWDDDVDVIIDRKNFLLLESVVSNSSQFVLEKENNRAKWLPRFRYKDKSKNTFEIELTIDVFIIDNVPDNRILAQVKQISIFALQGMIKNKPNLKKGNSLLKMASLVTFCMGQLFPMSFKLKMFDKVAGVSDKKSCANCACYTAEYSYARFRYDGKLLNELIEVEFEGEKIPISKYYDSYLTQIYGDYMTPPESSKRIAKHIVKLSGK